jgi:hypothetical protein
MEYKFWEVEYNITKGCIPIMLKAFSCGTRFVITSKELYEYENLIDEHFYCKRIVKNTDPSNKYIIVTNDERRRLIPILKKLQSELSI